MLKQYLALYLLLSLHSRTQPQCEITCTYSVFEEYFIVNEKHKLLFCNHVTMYIAICNMKVPCLMCGCIVS